jgi:methylated-DNA-[protein]-cysteine S-methyltransferase
MQPEYEPDDPVIVETIGQLQEYFSGRRKQFTVPLRLEGTPFQKTVWEALQAIPYGKTVSYAEIAARIGNPKAFRAVGMANNRNPIAIIVPCHRVIGKNGALVGYASGIAFKQGLLDLERRNS